MVYVKSYEAPAVMRGEILRYAGADPRGENSELLESCLDEMLGGLSYRVCYTELPLEIIENCVTIGSLECSSESLAKNLAGCERAIIFAATAGLFADRLIRKYSSLSPARALMLEAVGSERAESLCNAFCRDMAEEARAKGETLRPRFSPGYGDLPLELQRDIFSLLCPERHIGVTLGEGLLMVPSKSVTAIVGVSRL